MTSPETHARLDLWGRWVAATTLGWVIGILAAFPLSYFVVNLVYPRETNLIVGLCLGGAVGFCQAKGIHHRIRLSRSWVWGAALGLGIPFVLAVVASEIWPEVADYSDSWMLPGIVVGGLLAGALQVPALRAHTSNPGRWALLSGLSWGLAWLPTRGGTLAGILGGGVVLGAASGGLLLWLLRTPAGGAASPGT